MPTGIVMALWLLHTHTHTHAHATFCLHNRSLEVFPSPIRFSLLFKCNKEPLMTHRASKVTFLLWSPLLELYKWWSSWGLQMPRWSTKLDCLDLITILNLKDQFSQVSFEMRVSVWIGSCSDLRVHLPKGPPCHWFFHRHMPDTAINPFGRAPWWQPLPRRCGLKSCGSPLTKCPALGRNTPHCRGKCCHRNLL